MNGRRIPAGTCSFKGSQARKTLFILLALFMLFILFTPASSGEIRIGQTVYPSISDAISSAESGSTIIVSSGEYTGNFVIDKPVQLIGVDSGDGKPQIITVDGETGITINADNVVIEGFTITGDSECAVLINSDNNIIADNEILKTPVGITLFSSAGTSISGNTIKNHRIGLFIDDSAECDVYLNNFENTINAKSLSRSIMWSTASMQYIFGGQNFTSSLGNYWNDYYGSDNDNNGIGDTSYSLYNTLESGIFSTQNQLFMNNLNLQNLATGGSGYWQNLFYTSNYVSDDYPLIDHTDMYTLVAPAGTESGDNTGTAEQSPQPGQPTEGSPAYQHPQGSQPPENNEWWHQQSPFGIVILMLLIAGVAAGLIALSGGAGSLTTVKNKRISEILFFEAGYFALSAALLYTIISYTSRIVYGLIDFGYVQIIFILMTAYIIAASGIIGAGLIRSKLPLLLCRIQPVFAGLTTVMFFVSVYTSPVDLGPISSVAYPAALLLSALLPAVFTRLFRNNRKIWIKEEEDNNSRTMVMPYDQDSTVVFPDEESIMKTGLGSSYFPDTLNEKYKDVKFIGKGGIARVFRAKRRSDDSVVAVKVPINFDETTGRLFMKEMRIWEGLNHPNIVRLYSVNILPVPFVEMEYVPRAIADLDMPLSQKEAFDIIYGVAQGLSYAHKRHIIHRDIKPQNILISDDDTPKITDWGLGKIMGDGNETTTIGFSLNYAAPEQIAPKKFGRPDERTDIYQMGILFYEMLVGMRPFFGIGVADMSDEILHRTPLKPSENRPEDIIFDKIIMKMISKKPDDRYNTVDEIIGEFDKIKSHNRGFDIESDSDS
ncbi:parallel beta-helix repeat protein [Methanomicrobium sp. W14]|uniref:protein kinase domain-containing protein n=1 Tax=Methanomicrobium sp. W14 TaxID=2817839 RepID=UPI001AE36A94|nr:protein kinase [Methanomicrobium sp. W14]MBP2134284.1 parallel beta-helix repeat protein [Methanomicrobium sp. W14]